ncbi:MAG: ABC transporter permease subunit [Clostridiales bacterium]|nr:ABC transporter permease subunit [Clostridiales bacterium]
MKISTILKNKKTARLLVVIFWIAIWEIASLVIGREVYLPSPLNTVRALLRLSVTSKFWYSIAMTFIRVVAGFIISCLGGIILGIMCGLIKFLYELLNPLVIAVKSTPVMSIIIIALIWFQSGRVPVFVCFLMCFPIIWTNAVEGIRQVNRDLLQMAKVYRVNKGLIIRRIYIPSVTPYLIAGITTALGIGWKVTVAAEVLSNPKFSIGGNLYGAKVYLESSELFAWTSIVIILSFAFEYLFKYIIGKIERKGF